MPTGQTPAGHLCALTLAGSERRFPARPVRTTRDIRAAGAPMRQTHRARARADPPARPRALLPHRGRHRALGARAGHPVPGPRQRGQLGGALPGRHRGESARGALLFERFISVERREPPDIDVDFEHQRREEVIQYIYGKYGRHRAALTAVVIATGRAARCATSARAGHRRAAHRRGGQGPAVVRRRRHPPSASRRERASTPRRRWCANGWR